MSKSYSLRAKLLAGFMGLAVGTAILGTLSVRQIDGLTKEATESFDYTVSHIQKQVVTQAATQRLLTQLRSIDNAQSAEEVTAVRESSNYKLLLTDETIDSNLRRELDAFADERRIFLEARDHIFEHEHVITLKAGEVSKKLIGALGKISHEATDQANTISKNLEVEREKTFSDLYMSFDTTMGAIEGAMELQKSFYSLWKIANSEKNKV